MTRFKTLANIVTSIGVVAFFDGRLVSLSLTAKEAVVWDGSEPAPGIWFYWYEPSFLHRICSKDSRCVSGPHSAISG